MKTYKATRKQSAYLEGMFAHFRSELITAATFRTCGCITAEIGGVVRVVTCRRCESVSKRTERLNREIPRSCYCGQVDLWTAQTSNAFKAHDPESVEGFRKMRQEHTCEPRDRGRVAVTGTWERLLAHGRREAEKAWKETWDE